MSKLPITVTVNINEFSPDIFDGLAQKPFCFLLDSAGHRDKEGRYSFFGIDPVRIFSSSGALITIDDHSFIDNPIEALKRFEKSLDPLPSDPYLPFGGGLVGFVTHDWSESPDANPDLYSLPNAWFGLFDTILTFDHLEKSCWITSFGLTKEGNCNKDLAQMRCEGMLELLDNRSVPRARGYIIKPLIPEPASDFTKDDYISAIEVAKSSLGKKEWQRTNLARRFYSPLAATAWSIHKLFCKKNPTPYASFMRCGNFELSSTSPSCFLKLKDDDLTCNVVQKSIPRNEDVKQDKLNITELLNRATGEDPTVMDDEISLERVTKKRPDLIPAHIESDSRSHYLVNRIVGKKGAGLAAVECLRAAMPGASMTGVPKIPVNAWLKKTEPAKRQAYTGAIGYIGTNGDSQFNTAVRTMMVKDQIAFVHSGWQINEATDAEEAFYTSKKGVDKLFDEIKGLGK